MSYRERYVLQFGRRHVGGVISWGRHDRKSINLTVSAISITKIFV